MPHFKATLSAHFEAVDADQASKKWKYFLDHLPKPIGWYPKLSTDNLPDISIFKVEVKPEEQK